MPKIKIIADSTCDLSPGLVEKYDIEIISLYVNLGDRILRDGIEITPSDIYSYVEKTNILPGTIAPSVEDFKEVFAKWHQQGYQIICHTISSDMSSTYQNARIAAEETGEVWVVDSRNLSTGVGHVVIESAILAGEGLSAPEIVQKLQDFIPKVRASFILGDLNYMKKGGRCSGVMSLGANLLKIKPEIVVENGQMKVGHKFRGTLQKVLNDYVDLKLENQEDRIRRERIFITHTGCSHEIVEGVRERIRSHIPFDEIIDTLASSTVASHSGNNTLGILFVEK